MTMKIIYNIIHFCVIDSTVELYKLLSCWRIVHIIAMKAMRLLRLCNKEDTGLLFACSDMVILQLFYNTNYKANVSQHVT